MTARTSAANFGSISFIGKGHWNVDTLYILTTPELEAAWEPILGNWNADEVDFQRGDSASKLLGCWGGPPQSILRVVWD